MYQYRNLPPRHQAPGFYPPHQPSLRHQQTPHQHSLHPVDDQHSYLHSQPLTRSHSHGLLHHTSSHSTNNNGYRTHHIISPIHSPPPTHTHSNHSHSPPHNNHRNGTNPNALYAIQQMQRIKAATACQIINNRVVEAIREQQMKKLQQKIAKKKANPNWKDPNITNPNNPAYKPSENAKKKTIKNNTVKSPKINSNDNDTAAPSDESDDELTENDKMMTIPQLEISTAPKSTANITNLTDEELKMNPELYKMYSYYIPFATHRTDTSSHSSHISSHTHISHLRSQSLPPSTPTNNTTAINKHHHRTNMGPRRRNPNFLKPQYNTSIDGISDDGAVSSIVSCVSHKRAHSYSPNKNHKNMSDNHLHSPLFAKTKLVPIGKVKPNPLERNPPSVIIGKNNNLKRGNKHYEPHIAPAHANVQSVISPNGGIYHPCHGYSTRDISIFDLFPGIVKYQSKKYAEGDRVDYLLTLSEKSFTSVNNRPLQVDESEMWYIALKYLFNDITLGQFDYMSPEMRYVIKQYMSTHKNRLAFLNSIKNFGFLRVISDISKKLPIDRIQKIIKAEKEKAEKEKLFQLCARNRIKEENRKKLLHFQQQHSHHHQIYSHHSSHPHPHSPQFITHNTHPIYHPPPHTQSYIHHTSHTTTTTTQQPHSHYADWYNGNRLKRTISEPTPILYSKPSHTSHTSHTNTLLQSSQTSQAPTIIDDDEEEDDEDIDDSWNFITEIVNNNKINDEDKIPDLPPEKMNLNQSIQTSNEDKIDNVENINSKNHNENIDKNTAEIVVKNDDNSKGDNMDEIIDVYTMLYQSMKDNTKIECDNNNNNNDTGDTNDNGPNISFADLTNINNNISDDFVPKVNSTQK